MAKTVRGGQAAKPAQMVYYFGKTKTEGKGVGKPFSAARG